MSDYFPAELLSEILAKLPVKSLIRFTTVCKSWRSIITSPDFISSHLSNGKHHTLLLLRRYDQRYKKEHYSLLNVAENGTSFGIDSSSEIENPFKSRHGFLRIIGSCDGLVCLSDDYYSCSSRPVIIWNPYIRNHVVLPNPIIDPKEPHSFVLGFGVAANHAHHKVVKLVYYRQFKFGFTVPPLVEIFSFKTWSWRTLMGVDVRVRALKHMNSQAFLNGVVHWLACEPIDGTISRGSILGFDIGDEVFSEVMLPDELPMDNSTNLGIFVIGESLGIVKYEGEAKKSCDVWVMKEYCVKESWTKLYRIDLLKGMERVVGFSKNAEALVALQKLKLVAYNPKTKQSKDLKIYGSPLLFYIDNYVESLLLLRGHI